MATLTRMQQRRGTAEQWTDANTILAAGEIGFEADTGYFKVGNGTTAWTDLEYFKDASTISNELVDGAPDLLNTLNELAAALGDDPAFLTTLNNNVDTIESDVTTLDGRVDDLETSKATLTRSATKPTSPSNGDMWFDTASGEIFVYYEDGDSNQWFQV